MKRKNLRSELCPYQVRSEAVAFGVNDARTMEVAEKIAQHCRELGYEATIHERNAPTATQQGVAHRPPTAQLNSGE